MAIANSDGSIILSTKVDTSGVKKATNELRSEAVKLAAQYRKAGMTQSEAQKKAYRELGVTTKETEKATKATKKYGEQAKKSGGTAKSAFSSLGGALKKLAIAAAAAFSVQKIIQFSSEASNLATNTEASVQRLVDIYGSASKAVGDFIDANANALGMSRAAASSYASVYGNLFSVWADQATNAKLTNAYLNMTAVVASKTGRTVEDVQERVRSGLLGNTEAIEDLGIFVNVKTIEMTDAFQRMANGKSWEQLDAYTQQQIRSMAILEQATQKYGDQVAETSALTKSQFRSAWQDFQATWGQVVNRILVPILETLTDVLVAATSVMQSLSNITGATISQGDAIEDATDKQEGLTDAVKDTEAATKKALAGFDDLQILSSQNETTDGIVPPEIVVPEIEIESGENERLKKYQEHIILITDALEKLKTALSKFSEIDNDELSSDIDKLGESFGNLAGVAWGIILDAINNIIVPLAEMVVESDLAEYVADIVDSLTDLVGVAWQTIKDGINDVILPIVDIVVTDALPNFLKSVDKALGALKTTIDEAGKVIGDFFAEHIVPLAEWSAPKIAEFFDKVAKSLENLGKKIGETSAWKDFKTILDKIWVIIEPVLKLVLALLAGIATDAVKSTENTLMWFLYQVEDYLGLIAGLINGDFDKAAGHFWDLMTTNRKMLLLTALESVYDILNKISLFLWGETLEQSFLSFVNNIIGVFEKSVNTLIDLVNSFIDALNWTFGADIKHIDYVDWRIKTPEVAQGTTLPTNRGFLDEGYFQSKFANPSTPYSAVTKDDGGNTEVILQIDGREFGRAVVEQGNRENRRIGTRLVTS